MPEQYVPIICLFYQILSLPIDTTMKSLHLTQLIKIVDYDNVALNKMAWQSSIAYGGNATRAVDGKVDPDFNRGKTCTHTKYENSPWWMVDLTDQYEVIKVAITSRYHYGDCLKCI